MGCVSSKDGTTPAPGVARASSAAPTTIAGATAEARTATVAREEGFAEVPLRPGHERKRGSGRERETRATERGTPSASDAAVIRDMTDAVSSVGKGGGDEGGRASERKDDTEAETGGTATRRVGEVEVAEKERAQTGAGEAETRGGAGDDGTRRAARGGASEELKVGGQGPVLERPERREIPKNMLIT